MERHERAVIPAHATCCQSGTEPQPRALVQPKQSHISLIASSGTGQTPSSLNPCHRHLHRANIALPLLWMRWFPWHNTSRQQVPDVTGAKLSLCIPAGTRFPATSTVPHSTDPMEERKMSFPVLTPCARPLLCVSHGITFCQAKLLQESVPA